jgi:hypothetical protein
MTKFINSLFVIFIYLYNKKIMSNKFGLGLYEKSHILALHEEERKKLINILDDPNTRSKIKTLAEQYTGKAGANYASVAACKTQTPSNVAANAGLSWTAVKQSWGTDGKSAAVNIEIRNALCDGWRPGDPKQGGQNTNAGQDVNNQGGNNNSSGDGGLNVTTEKEVNGLVTTTTTKGCVNTKVEGSFSVMNKSESDVFVNFMTEFNRLLTAYPMLKNAKDKGTLILTSIRVIGGASNTYGGKTQAEMTNDRQESSVPCTNCTGNFTKNKQLAVDRATGLKNYALQILKSQSIKVDPNLSEEVKGYNVDTGGRPDKGYSYTSKSTGKKVFVKGRDVALYPKPGQFAQIDFGFCGVDTTSEEQVLTKEEFENCFQGIEIEVNFDKDVRTALKGKSGKFPDLKFHKCNAAVFEVFANGQQLFDTTGKNYADLNNYGTNNPENEPNIFNGIDKFAKFVLSSETNKDKIQQMWQDAQARKDYTGDINIVLRCGPSDKIGKDDNSKMYGGNCHSGVGHVIVRNNGQEMANLIQGTPSALGSEVKMNPIQACKPTVKQQ